MRALAGALGLPVPESTILSIPVHDADLAQASLESAGVRAAVRAGSVRVSSHFYNVRGDADRAAGALQPLLTNQEA